MTVEIPQKHWAQFCDKLNESQTGAMMDIRVQADGDFRLVAQSVPLKSTVFDEGHDACNNAIVIEFGLPNEKPSQHSVLGPARLVLRKQTDGDNFNLLEMPAENGMTVVIFHPGISRSFLKTLQIAT